MSPKDSFEVPQETGPFTASFEHDAGCSGCGESILEGDWVCFSKGKLYHCRCVPDGR